MVRRAVSIGMLLGAGFLIAIMLLIVVNIVARLFGRAIIGIYELIELTIVVTIAFALAYTALRQGHVVVEVLVSRLPQRIQAILRILTSLIGLGIWAVIVWASVWIMRERVLIGREQTALLGVPFLPFRCVWVLALLLFWLVLLLDLFKAVRK